MANYSEEKIESQYQKLPQVLKNALYDPEIAEKIFSIGEKHKLTIEKIGFLAEEAGYIVLGLSRPEEFVNALKERLAVDESEAREIAKDISREIFLPLRSALKSAHETEIEEEAPKAPSVEPRPDARAAVPTPPIPSQAWSIPKPSIPIEVKPPTSPLPTPLAPTPPSQAPEKKPMIPPLPKPKIPPIDLRPDKKPILPPEAPKTPPIDLRSQVKPILPEKPEINPPTFQRSIEPRRSDLKPPSIPVAKPPGIRDGEGIKRGIIFAAPVEGEPRLRRAAPVEGEPNSPTPEDEKTHEETQAAPPKPPEKKAPYGGFDPYREPVE